jgi:hypothetical protein
VTREKSASWTAYRRPRAPYIEVQRLCLCCPSPDFKVLRKWGPAAGLSPGQAFALAGPARLFGGECFQLRLCLGSRNDRPPQDGGKPARPREALLGLGGKASPALAAELPVKPRGVPRPVGHSSCNSVASFAWIGKEAPPRLPATGRRRQRSRGSHRAMWVVPSSPACSSLTRRQRTQFGPNSGAAILRFT